MIVAVDASVIIKWYIPENLSEEAVEFGEWVMAGHHIITAPSYVLIETANVLWKKAVLIKEIGRQEAEKIVSEINKLQIHLIPDDQLLNETLKISMAKKIPVYDCLYLTVAKRCHAPLVTADRELARLGAHPEKVVHLKEWRDLKS